MSSAFWTNTIWYILLGAAASMLLTYSFIKSRYKLFTLNNLLAAIGLAAAVEFFVLIIFNAYVYFPKLHPEPYFDNITGSLFSQVFILPATAIFIAVLQLRWYWYIIFACIFYSIEILFVTLGIFGHYWWNPWYTSIALISYFIVAKNSYKSLLRSSNRFMHYTLSFFALYAVLLLLDTIFVSMLGTRYAVNLTNHLIRDNMIMSVLHASLLAAFYLVLRMLKAGPLPSAVVIVLLTGVDFFLVRFNILQLKSEWFLAFSAAINIVGFLMSLFIDRFLKVRPERIFY